jgi:hypothetical protein
MPPEPQHCTQDEIDSLIGCPKLVFDPPKRDLTLDRGHFRNDMRLKSTNGNLEFRAFMREWRSFPGT